MYVYYLNIYIPISMGYTMDKLFQNGISIVKPMITISYVEISLGYLNFTIYIPRVSLVLLFTKNHDVWTGWLVSQILCIPSSDSTAYHGVGGPCLLFNFFYA